MTLLTSFNVFRKTGQPAPDHRHGWPLVLLVIVLLSLGGWLYLAAMIADMVPVMDMGEAGPGMSVFNAFNLFAGLSAEARAALAVLCLPAGATFGMPGAEMSLADLGKIFTMWSMMALAMMLPTAIPVLRSYSMEVAGRGGTPAKARAAGLFATFGYLAVWIAYAVLATAAQWLLARFGALTDMMAPASLALTTSVLFAAGLYQFTPAKQACLARCWYPRWAFSGGHAEPGAVNGFREGLVQGWVCLGCCWAVMTVMFAVGLMNILWIAFLGGLMAVEKAFPNRYLPYIIGAGLLTWAAFLVFLILTGRMAA
jgi:predicted metal-binding membrane protein